MLKKAIVDVYALVSPDKKSVPIPGIKLATTGLLLTFFSFITYAQPLNTAKLDLLFARLSEKNKAMGSIVIYKDGKELYNHGFGFSQITGDEKKPITATTRFKVGSVTKMFTSTLIFQLIEQKKLKLNDKLSIFFPQIIDADKITIEHLLAHRSGIHEVTENGEFRNRRFTPLAKDEMVGIIANGKLDFEPGTKYAYSSSGYYLLGLIIEKLTAKPYEEVLQERICKKINLRDTYAATEKINVNRNESFSYRYARSWEQQPESHTSIFFGSGALISTPRDMAKFIGAFFDGKLISAESLAKVTQNKLGIDSFTYNGKIAYGHTGGIDGFGAWLAYIPAGKVVLSYATNGKVYPVANIIDAVFDIYFNKSYTVPTFESPTIPTAISDKYLGVYSTTEAPIKCTITREGAKLFVRMADNSVAALEPTGPDKFKIEAAPVEFRFDVTNGQLIITKSGRDRVLTKEK